MTTEPAEDLTSPVVRGRRGAAELADLLDFFENGPVALHWVAVDGTILRANRAELELLGYSPDEYVGHNIRDFHADPSAIEDILARLRGGETLRDYEARLQCKDGAVKHVLLDANVLRRNGEFVHTRCVTRDNTERKQLEEQLAASRVELDHGLDELATLYNLAPMGIAIAADPACRRIEVNPALAEILQVPAGENASLSAPSGEIPSYRVLRDGCEVAPADLPLQRAAREGRAVEHAEYDVLRPDGTVRTIYGFASPLFDKDRTPRGAIGAFIDISDRKSAELALAESESKTRASEQRYRTLAETIPALITLSEITGEIVYCNPWVLEYTGMTFEELRDDWGNIFHPEDMEAHRDEWLRAMRHAEPITTEFRVRRHDGAYRWHLGRLTYVRDDEGNITGWIGAHVDIDDQKRVLAQLQDALAVKDEFLGLVSHELKTPITTILGNAQILNRIRTIEDDERNAALADIAFEAERLHRIIDNMLVLARLESGRQIEPEPLHLQRVIETLAARHHQRHPTRRIDLQIDSTLPIVSAEEGYVEQVLRNLLSNAEKYSPGEEPITIAARSQGNEVLVAVLDRGPGISPSEADELFTPFYRSPQTSHQAQGMGIGLTVCKRLIEALNGRMWAIVRAGGGSDIGFALPVEHDDDPEV